MAKEILIILVAVVLIAPLLAAQNSGTGDENKNKNSSKERRTGHPGEGGEVKV
jgi:hypothetical protein